MKKEISYKKAQQLIEDYKNNYNNSLEKEIKYKLESIRKTKLYFQNRLNTDKIFAEEIYKQI